MKHFSSGAGISLLIASIASVTADEYNHRYSQGDKVNFYVHKVSLSAIVASMMTRMTRVKLQQKYQQ